MPTVHFVMPTHSVIDENPALAAVAAGLGLQSFVHHGSLAVESSIEPEFRKAETYLRGDSIMRRTLHDLEHAPQTTTVLGNPFYIDRYSPSTRTIEWDPYSALRTSRGGLQSPALGLATNSDMPTRTCRRTCASRQKRCCSTTTPRSAA